MVTNITAVGSPDRAERAILEVILAGLFLANSGCICGRGATVLCRNPILSSNTFIWGHLFKIAWKVTREPAVGSPDRAEQAILRKILAGRIFGQIQALFVVGGHLRCGNPLFSSNNFTQGHLIKMKWFVANVITVGSPDRAERAILGCDFGWEFLSIQDAFVVGTPLCDL